MLRRSLPLILGLLLVLGACSSLETEDSPPQNLIPLSSLPAEYGELVTVLHYDAGSGPLVWDELWFENEDTGVVTRVPVYRPTWSYDPARVRRIERAPAGAASGGDDS